MGGGRFFLAKLCVDFQREGKVKEGREERKKKKKEEKKEIKKRKGLSKEKKI